MNEQMSRRTRFEERVRVERMFLSPVNRVFGTVAPLAGMTGDAIESWENRALATGTERNVQQISKLLREASRRAELLADNSRDVFERDQNVGPDGLNEICLMLESELA